jgi:hypothetical protein
MRRNPHDVAKELNVPCQAVLSLRNEISSYLCGLRDNGNIANGENISPGACGKRTLNFTPTAFNWTHFKSLSDFYCQPHNKSLDILGESVDPNPETMTSSLTNARLYNESRMMWARRPTGSVALNALFTTTQTDVLNERNNPNDLNQPPSSRQNRSMRNLHGLPAGCTIELVGHTGAGKSRVCCSLVSACALQGLQVLVVDVCNSFSIQNLHQFFLRYTVSQEHISQAIDRVHIQRCSDLHGMLNILCTAADAPRHAATQSAWQQYHLIVVDGFSRLIAASSNDNGSATVQATNATERVSAAYVTRLIQSIGNSMRGSAAYGATVFVTLDALAPAASTQVRAIAALDTRPAQNLPSTHPDGCRLAPARALSGVFDYSLLIQNVSAATANQSACFEVRVVCRGVACRYAANAESSDQHTLVANPRSVSFTEADLGGCGGVCL